jgi:hypothetical protein
MDQDREYIRLLAVFHWVVAGIAALFALFPVIHLILGLAIVNGELHGRGEEPIARLVGWMFVLFATGWILAGLTFAVCLAIAGRCLSQHRHHRYCIVMAGISCMFVPFGTVLGVFTIVLLMKDSVRSMFSPGPVATAAPPP